MVEKMKTNKDEYKTLLKDVILQGLIKLMEAEVCLKCRKSDEELVKSVMNDAAKEYKALMKKEVAVFKDRDVPINL